MPSTWTDSAARFLLDTTACPRCNTVLSSAVCDHCRADLSGEKAVAVAQASRAAADALTHRQSLIDGLDTKLAALTVPAAAAAQQVVAASPAAPVTAGPPVAAPPTAQTRPASQISVQSVLAVAGAGLFAVAAIVFTFFNPDLTNFATRTTIIAVITLIFLGGSWLLAHRNLQFSAEAVGALGAVFAALDVWAFSDSAPGSATGWLFLAIGTAVASAGLIALAIRVRVRTWLWSGLVGMQLVPLFLAWSVAGRWSAAIGFVAVGFAGLAAHLLARRLSARFDSPLLTERVTATIIQLGVLPLIAAQLAANAFDYTVRWTLPASGIIALTAILAGLAARTLLPRFWSYLAGALAIAALINLPFEFEYGTAAWLLALAPIVAAAGVSALAWVSPRLGVRPGAVRAGAVTVALIASLPALSLFFAQVGAALGQLVLGTRSYDLAVGETATVGADYGIAAVIALAATAAGLLVVSLATRHVAGKGFRAAAVWFAATALVTFATWSAFVRPAQAIIALVAGVVISIALARLPRLAAAPLQLRLPAIVGAHVLVVLAGVISWTDEDIRVLIGIGVVIGVLALSLALPRVVLPLYVGVAYAYALAVIAAALTLLGFETIAVLCLTTTIGAIGALIATMTPWLGVRSWYAVLLVTSVPFAIGVISVLIDRSGWTALSTGVTFALLLALMLTRREGMTRFLRTAAASLLVPALAVVVICLGAQVLSVSASPITLPVIAVIGACTLAATGIIGAFLVRHGIGEADARAARIAIEVSSLVTGAIAVLLALVRAAAGIPTTFLVLLILGIGAIATALFGKRRYGWPVAGAAWTGALWCVWSLAGITTVEPYLLPPALGTAIAGAFLVARGLPGMGLPAVGLVWTGLATATVPTLAILGFSGSDGALVPWRAIGLLGGSLVLIVLGALIPRLSTSARLSRIGVLRTPLLVVAIAAAAGGAIQAIRYGVVDAVAGMTGEAGMVPVLASSAIAVILATVAGRLLAADAASTVAVTARLARSRALYVPAVLYLVIGPIFAIRSGWFPILTVLALMLAVLTLMIVTTVRARTRDVTLPPVAFLFAVAWCTGVASWSQRELRVEAYSLPLGVALLAVGIIAMVPHPHHPARASLRTWPMGFEGSWPLIGPGIIAIFLPSVLATGTDPLTQRAIMVIALALIAILIGNMRRLAAPFILGIIVLPIENIVVFAVQIGRSIGALPWWITLATAGAVLLVIAVSSERRVGGEKGAAARLRDLK